MSKFESLTYNKVSYVLCLSKDEEQRKSRTRYLNRKKRNDKSKTLINVILNFQGIYHQEIVARMTCARQTERCTKRRIKPHHISDGVLFNKTNLFNS